MKPIVILYHANCPDGFGAAWAAWKKFGNRAEYIPVNPETLPEKPLKNKIVYTLDMSFKAPIFRKLMRENKSVVSLDHHFSRKKDVEAFPQNVFDNDHCGSMIAWKYFHPGKKIPLFIKYLEDNDLWRFRLPYAKELSSVVFLLEFDFKDWSRFIARFENKKERNKIFEQANNIFAYEQKIAALAVERAALVRFEGYRTLAANSAILESEIGHRLCNKLPPIGIIWRQKKNRINVSLRSNGKVDVSKLAQRYGGGGHKKASGFAFKATGKFPWKLIKEKNEK
ncbi:MAG: DHHA1 domain-containing protein [Patescibacteria group bacterium]